MNKEQLKEAVGELNFVNTVFEADGVSYIDTAVSVAQVYGLIDQLDEPEVLSQEWIEENSLGAFELEGTLDVPDERFVSEHVLQNLLVPKQELPVIPKYVADWIEDLKSKEINLLENIYDFTHEEDINNYIREQGNALMRAWLDGYEVEKEKLYYTVDEKGQTLLLKSEEGIIRSNGTDLEIVLNVYEHAPSNMYQLTEKQIKDYDERYWAFAVEVAE